MNLQNAIVRLSSGLESITALARSARPGQARWKPSPEAWSILEVICHLHDEEVEDFRMRVDYTLHRPGEAWPSIEPGEWVTKRAYNQQDFPTALERFTTERQGSLHWLRTLKNPDLTLTYEHPMFGPMTAGLVLDAWAAHDHLHIRQLNELHWQYFSSDVTPGALDYAGGW
jgi:DinB superfamily